LQGDPPAHSSGAPKTPYKSPFRSVTQELFKAKGRKRLAWATVLTGLVLGLLALLGPSREDVKRRFELHPGAEGPLEIMPEISIEKGQDPAYQLPRYFRKTPPPPHYEVEPENPYAEEVAPPRPLEPENLSAQEIVDPATDPDLDQVDLVEFQLPQQTNPWFVLIRMIRPQYPINATERQRRTPVIEVEVAIYINEKGQVTASMILASEGGPVFNEVVLKAVNQWLYKPITRNGRGPEGRWQTIIWRFKSPYFGRSP
jgi:TonB family protein